MSTESDILDFLTEDLESRLPDLLKRFPEKSEDEIRQITEFDPTPNKAYLFWILSRGKEGQFSLPKDGAYVTKLLSEFNRVRKLSGYTGNKDLLSIKSIDVLKQNILLAHVFLQETRHCFRKID